MITAPGSGSSRSASWLVSMTRSSSGCCSPSATSSACGSGSTAVARAPRSRTQSSRSRVPLPWNAPTSTTCRGSTASSNAKTSSETLASEAAFSSWSPSLGTSGIGIGSLGFAAMTRLWETLTLPVTVFFLFSEARIHPGYGMTWQGLAARRGGCSGPRAASAAAPLEGPPGDGRQAPRDPAGRGRRGGVRVLPRGLHRQPVADLRARRAATCSSTTRSRACRRRPARPVRQRRRRIFRGELDQVRATCRARRRSSAARIARVVRATRCRTTRSRSS